LKRTIAFLALYLFGFIPVEAQKDNLKKNYVVDTVASEVLWFCGQHYGCIGLDTGSIEVVKDKIVGGSFIIDLNTVEDDDITDNMLLRLTLNNVIKSLSFFNVETFPHSKFRIEEVEKIDSDYYRVSGILEIHDVVRDINFFSKIIFENERIIVESEIINIDRTNWGVNYLSQKFDPEGKETMYVPDTISLKVHLFADKIKKKKK
jgi:hypothetical protein